MRVLCTQEHYRSIRSNQPKISHSSHCHLHSWYSPGQHTHTHTSTHLCLMASSFSGSLITTCTPRFILAFCRLKLRQAIFALVTSRGMAGEHRAGVREGRGGKGGGEGKGGMEGRDMPKGWWKKRGKGGREGKRGRMRGRDR